MNETKEHVIYDNLIEATRENQLDIKKDWRVGQPGDWVISDCGKVLEVLKVSPGFVCTATGQYMTRAKKGMYIDKTNEPESDPKQTYLTIKQLEFVRQYTIFFDVNKAFAAVYTTDTNCWRERARRVFNQPKVQSEIEKRMRGMLSDLRIDDKYFLTNLKRMVEEGSKPSQLDALRDLKGYIEDVLREHEDRANMLQGLQGQIEDAKFVVQGGDDDNNKDPNTASTEKPDTSDNAGKGSEDSLQAKE